MTISIQDCRLLHLLLPSVPKQYATRMEQGTCSLKGGDAAETARNWLGLHLSAAFLQRSTQVDESPLSDVETTSGSVDGHDSNPPARRRVGQPPAFAAVGGAPLDVECAADVWEAGEIPEVRVFIGETVRPVRARDVVGVAVRVVVRGVPGDFIGGNGVVVRGVVLFLERCNIATSGHGTSDVREEECEDERSEVDHCVVKA